MTLIGSTLHGTVWAPASLRSEPSERGPVPPQSNSANTPTANSESGPAQVAEHEEGPRQRAMRVDVRISREAMQAVLPANQQIGPWQARAAHLLALAEKLRSSGRTHPALAEEAQAMLCAVERQQHELDSKRQELPSDVAASSRLEDTGRALSSVETVLRKTLAALGVRREEPASAPAARSQAKRAGSPRDRTPRATPQVPPRP